jgi:hypothetical protein
MEEFRSGGDRFDRESLEKLSEFREFSRRHPMLMHWLDMNADAPVAIDTTLLEKTARANTFKEIRNYILSKEHRLTGDDNV